MSAETTKQMTWHKNGKRFMDEYKSRDNVKARVDVEMLCDREKLHMQPPTGRRKNWFKPHANFCLDSNQKKEAFRWLKYAVMFPDGYCSNISKGVNLSTGKVTGLKSHDYHIWIQRLMPVMLRGYLPEKVWRVLAEVSHFFRTLCAKQICPKVIDKLEVQVPELLCKLETIFPPGFFTPMAHALCTSRTRHSWVARCSFADSFVLRESLSIFER